METNPKVVRMRRRRRRRRGYTYIVGGAAGFTGWYMGTGYMDTGVQCGRVQGWQGWWVHGTRYVLWRSTEQHSRARTVAVEMDSLGFSCFWALQGRRCAWCLVLLCWEKMLAVAADQAARMGSCKVLGTCAVRYCTLPLQRKLGLGAGKQLERARRRRRRASGGGGGGVCGEREKRDRKNEQGTRDLGVCDRGSGGRDKTFWGRKETENSAVGCALSRTVPEPSWSAAWGRGKGGGGSTV